MSIVINTKEVPEKSDEHLQAIPADYRRLHGVMELHVNQSFLVLVAYNPHLFVILIDKSAVLLTDRQNLYNVQLFSIMVGSMLQCIHVDHMFL